MKYTLELSFWGKPVCYQCILSMIEKGKCICGAMAMRPECPEVGCRKDCTLKAKEEAMIHEFKPGDDCPFCEGRLIDENGLKCSSHCYFDKVKWEPVKEDENK